MKLKLLKMLEELAKYVLPLIEHDEFNERKISLDLTRLSAPNQTEIPAITPFFDWGSLGLISRL